MEMMEEMEEECVPVTIVTGFLGSGKTTLGNIRIIYYKHNNINTNYAYEFKEENKMRMRTR